jgi:hypothetical protein
MISTKELFRLLKGYWNRIDSWGNAINARLIKYEKTLHWPESFAPKGVLYTDDPMPRGALPTNCSSC